MKNDTMVIVRPRKGWMRINLGELWSYHHLLMLLVTREIKVRYRQTILGIAWAIIQPLLMMVVFSLFFGKFINVSRDNISYPLFSYAALLPWMLFSEGLTRSTNSVVQNTNLVQKIYFPKLILPLAGALSPLVDFIFAFIVFIAIMYFYEACITIKILLLPVFLGLTIMSSLSIGFWLSALNVQYRDVRYVTPFLIQVMFFASPVVYSSNSLPPMLQSIYGLNPMVGIIEGFRWILLGAQSPSHLIIVSAVITTIMFISGAFYFRRMEKYFADMV